MKEEDLSKDDDMTVEAVEDQRHVLLQQRRSPGGTRDLVDLRLDANRGERLLNQHRQQL